MKGGSSHESWLGRLRRGKGSEEKKPPNTGIPGRGRGSLNLIQLKGERGEKRRLKAGGWSLNG